MSSVFAALRAKLDSYATRRLAEDLEIGKKYPCYNFVQRLSQFKNKATDTYPQCLVAYVKDGSNKYFIYMPSIYNDLSEQHLKELNDQVAAGTPPWICSYGKRHGATDIMLHEFGEGYVVISLTEEYIKICVSKINGERLQDNERESPLKRTASEGDDATSSKKHRHTL